MQLRPWAQRALERRWEWLFAVLMTKGMSTEIAINNARAGFVQQRLHSTIASEVHSHYGCVPAGQVTRAMRYALCIDPDAALSWEQ